MRTDFLNLFSKVSKSLHVSHYAHALCKHFAYIPKYDLTDGNAYLQTWFADKYVSCITSDHIIDSTPLCDVQIIIPAYNVEPYIKECLDSVLGQETNYLFHVFIVNDGSTDNTEKIIQTYLPDPRITYIHQANQGLSGARNVALKRIQAKYILFVDSDDRLRPHAIETLMQRADQTNADIIEGNHIKFRGKDILRYCQHPQYAYTHLFGMACAKLYKASLLEKICFPLGYWYEDTIDWMILYQMTDKKEIVEEYIYDYRQTKNSITSGNNTSKRRIETYWLTKHLLEDAKALHLAFTDEFYTYFLKQCRLNSTRLATLGNHQIEYALFIEQQKLLRTYFTSCTALTETESRLATYLQQGDFKQYLLDCYFL